MAGKKTYYLLIYNKRKKRITLLQICNLHDPII